MARRMRTLNPNRQPGISIPGNIVNVVIYRDVDDSDTEPGPWRKFMLTADCYRRYIPLNWSEIIMSYLIQQAAFRIARMEDHPDPLNRVAELWNEMNVAIDTDADLSRIWFDSTPRFCREYDVNNKRELALKPSRVVRLRSREMDFLSCASSEKVFVKDGKLTVASFKKVQPLVEQDDES